MTLENYIVPEVLPFSPLFQIKPTYSLSGINDSGTHLIFLNTIQQIINSMIPESLLAEAGLEGNPDAVDSIFYRLNRMLPLFRHSKIDESSDSFSFTYLCPAEYTHGVGRYVIDTLSRWLFPGKQIEISGGICLNIQFVRNPSLRFFLDQEIISIRNKEERQAMSRSLPRLMEEMKINIMSVYQARYIASLRSVSMHQKNLLIKENLSNLLNQSIDEGNRSLYDQMQDFITKLSSEEKIDQVKKNISYLVQSRPKTFDRDVFYEMTHLTNLFSNQFSSTRETRHISRVIAYKYLFKKNLQEQIQSAPLQRHLSIKILKTVLTSKEPILGILIAINFLRDAERFEIRNLLDAVRSCLPNAMYVEKSLISDRRHEKIGVFYLEIHKEAFQNFSQVELKQLRQKLPSELIRQIENIVHPIFMPRNEEEIIRNLIVLSKQIKYVRDLPQVSIHYDKQTESELTFTVLLARLLREDPLNKILETAHKSLKIDIDDIRIMGYVKQKYPKEAAILHVTLEKFPFFRPDYSVDLLRARQKIVFEFTQLLGEFRDFNGGMILKQDEALEQLRQELGPLSKDRDFLLENYFYSLRPGIMQTILDSHLLKNHFKILIEVLENSQEPYQMRTQLLEKFFIGFISVSAPTLKEELINAIGKLKIPSYEFTTSHLQVEKIFTYGFILRVESPDLDKQLEQTIQSVLAQWSDRFFCRIKL